MRSRLLMFLLLLSILIHNAQGIRLIAKGSAAAHHSLLSLHQEKFEGTGMRSNEGDEDGKKKWSGRSIRKLTMITITKTDEEIKVEKNNTAREEQNLSVNSPEMIDIAAMDYNLARRKPPIHN